MKISFPKFYPIVLGLALFVSAYLFYDAETCTGWFCAAVVYYIPPLWVVATVACVGYFIASRKGKNAEICTQIAIATAIIFCFCAYTGLKIWDYYQNKPYKDEVAAEQAKCPGQVSQFYDRYNINNFSEKLHRDKSGKIDNLIIGFNLSTKGYNGTVNITAQGGAYGLDTMVGSGSVGVRDGSSTAVSMNIPVYTTTTQNEYASAGTDTFNLNLTDSDTKIKDVQWYFSWWIGGKSPFCEITIGGPNTLERLVPELSVTHN